MNNWKAFSLLLATSALLSLAPVTAAEKPPNIVIIMVDDMGFSDIGCYGSEIETPHLDALAGGGMRFSQFYNTGRCCPTRAALLTGLYQHQAGIGHMTGDQGRPAYQGYLNDRCLTIGEALKPAGYFTAVSGKWHVGSAPEHWPRQRGFDRFYGIPQGGGHHHRMLPGRTLVSDDAPIDVPSDWYSTTAFTDHAVELIEEGFKADKPVFLYLAYTAPHWPLQAPEEVTERFIGRYSEGWQPHRQARFRRQMEMGMFPLGTKLAPLDPKTLKWDAAEDKVELDRRMAIHAAMVHLIDEGVGQVVTKLREQGELDNTLILFLSDNGASAEGGATGFVKANRGDPNAKTGTPESYVSFGTAGANMCDTPFRKYKMYMHEGGIATPLIAHWPSGIPTNLNGTWTQEIGHVIDLLPTCLAAADSEYPTKRREKELIPLAGCSLVPALQGNALPERELYFEHQGNAAVRDGKWKLVRQSKQPWELYDLEADRAEGTDLSVQNPEQVTELRAKWVNWANEVGVHPVRP
ncbi:arylsulfatase [Allorhodopirellula solitaria]|uniref:Arylsulfatase n=1 Tax=Allorhodopirellula solitaria TaxID=2527987 RepID=A0A5C5YJQ7_9BACT|nr:arylsulfatase [Allorhodopirellula solitaria]TWT75049.1 Arylsulfatase [Allorhodopirellula solitaria]